MDVLNISMNFDNFEDLNNNKIKEVKLNYSTKFNIKDRDQFKKDLIKIIIKNLDETYKLVCSQCSDEYSVSEKVYTVNKFRYYYFSRCDKCISANICIECNKHIKGKSSSMCKPCSKQELYADYHN